jgi:hypothetical protein
VAGCVAWHSGWNQNSESLTQAHVDVSTPACNLWALKSECMGCSGSDRRGLEVPRMIKWLVIRRYEKHKKKQKKREENRSTHNNNKARSGEEINLRTARDAINDVN